MTLDPRLPASARLLLRLSRVPHDMRGEVLDDLHELFVERRRQRGAIYAHWRLYHDVLSLWLRRWPAARPMPRPSFSFLRDARADLRYAIRLFARQPAILILTIAGLSIGLGIATSAFSLMNAAVLRGEGVVDPDRAPGILRVSARFSSNAWQYSEFVHLREGATRMQVEAVLTDEAPVRTTDAETEGPLTEIAFVSGGFFAATGGRVTAGRALDVSDEKGVAGGGQPTVVVSHVFWTSRLNRDPAVVGRTIRVGRTAATIVGVAARGFSVPSNRLVWMPFSAHPVVYSTERDSPTPDMPVEVFGRLVSAVSPQEAEAQLSGVAATLPRNGVGGESQIRTRLDSHVGLGRVPSSDVLGVTVFVFAVIGLVLLLACANAATVLVATAITREREMGVRAALGASRMRIGRQLVTESVALGAIAAIVGLGISYWVIPVIGRMIEAPAGADLAPDLTVYLFVAIVTLITGIGAGLAPAWHGRGADLLSPLKGEGAHENRLRPRRLQSTLVATQAAVSVLLIVLASLFMRATFLAATADVGFDAAGLYGVSATLGRTDRDGVAIRNFWERGIAEVRAIPGVTSVALAEMTPFGDAFMSSITREQPARTVYLNRTRAEFFTTLGLRVLAGRIYTANEVAAGTPVAVISRSLARAYWHDQSPVGQMLPAQIPLPTSARPIIVGVVADAITARLHERSAFAIYEPLDPPSEKFARLIVRVRPGTGGVMEQLRQRLQSIDSQADVRIVSVADKLHQEASRPRMLAALTGTVGIVAIALCVIGLYGLTASVVGQRTREMGVRIAMGAQPQDLLGLLLWDSLKPAIIGLTIAAGAALLASRVVVSAMFFGVSPHDPVAFAGAAGTLLVAAMLAVLVPTRRAASTDAAAVLRRS